MTKMLTPFPIRIFWLNLADRLPLNFQDGDPEIISDHNGFANGPVNYQHT
jgi:hypothetical protein